MTTTFSLALRSLWNSWLKPLILASVVVFPLKSAVADWNWVPSGSMRPTILEGDFVFVNKLAYDLKFPFTTHHLAHWADPQRGDIVVCFSPEDGRRLVKRVIGLPGDRLEMVGERLYVNGQPLSYQKTGDGWRRYLTRDEQARSTLAEETLGSVRHPVIVYPGSPLAFAHRTYVVPADHYFMMGDNRDLSYDSRYFGPVARAQIVGQAKAIVLSFDPSQALLPRVHHWFSRLN